MDHALVVDDGEGSTEEEGDGPVERVQMSPETPTDLGLLVAQLPTLSVNVHALSLRESNGCEERA